VTAEIVKVATADLESLDHSAREAALTQYLTGARDWLAKAVDITGPDAIVSAKAEIATAAEAAKQLGLSKEIQLDAQEMVRRADYALDRAIRKGQSEGTVSSDHNAAAVRYGHLDQTSIPSPADYYGGSGQARSDAYQMGNAEPSEFDAAIDEARSEGNLSRANVVRKVKSILGKDLSVQTACGIDNSFADGLKGVRSWLDTLTTNPTPEQAEALANTLRRYLRKIERNLP
jgi:hypothetical protein